MINNIFRESLLKENRSFGSWIMIGHPAIGEILSNAGFEWIAIDLEHTDIDVNSFSNLTRGMLKGGSIPIARVRENNTLAIRQVLDAGAMGVLTVN